MIRLLAGLRAEGCSEGSHGYALRRRALWGSAALTTLPAGVPSPDEVLGGCFMLVSSRKLLKFC